MNDQVAGEAGSSDSTWSRPERLQQAREGAGLHIAALAAALKVPVRKLEALEAGRYEELPDLTFARALASSACRHLRIDPAPVLAQIPLPGRPVLADTTKSLDTSFRSPREGAIATNAGAPARRVWWVAAVLGAGAVALYFWPAALDEKAPGPVPAEMVRPAPAESQAPVPPAGEGAPAADSPQALPLLMPEPSAAPALPEQTGSAVQGTAAPTEPAAEAPPPDPGKLLVIRARGETWIEVVNGAGSVVVQRVLRAGDSVDFSASPPYAVVIGRADAVDVFVRGNAFDVLPHARNSVARFEVK